MARVTDSTNLSRIEYKTLYSLVPAVFTGIGVGIAAWLLFALLQHVILYYVACQAQSSIIGCSNRADIASALALLLASFGGLLALVRHRVFRPMLVVIASAASLWTVPVMLMNMTWYASLLVMMLATVAVYSLFTWINDFRRFSVALILAVVVVIALRLLLIA